MTLTLHARRPRRAEVSDRELLEAFTNQQTGEVHDLDALFQNQHVHFKPCTIVQGRVTAIAGDSAVVDIGYKSEGFVPLGEWPDRPRVGDRVEVLLERVEDDSGAVVLSPGKARWYRAFQAFVARHRVGDRVTGTVKRTCKGGLIVDVGVNAFMPASQVDIRRVADFGGYVGKAIECSILRVDPQRRSVVVSRRKILADRGCPMSRGVPPDFEPGQVRRGVVKNIAEFGAFVDLGGIDGLLHVSEMAWQRVADARNVVRIDQQLEVFVLRVDRQRHTVSLSLKRLTASPWAGVAGKYPAGSRHPGEVVHVAPYGAFVELEPGVEGLLHVSEFAAGDALAPGSQVEVLVLRADADERRIALSRRRPWPAGGGAIQ